MLERSRNGKPVPAPLLRMRAEDLLVQAFPAAVACGETLPPGDIDVPLDHPIVRQTIEDCLSEALDAEGMLDVLRALEDGRIRKHAVDTTEPSCFAHGILSAQVYSFLDDAPLEERRTQAVRTRRAMNAQSADEIGVLDADAIERVRQEAWPAPESAEEVHEVLLWMGFATERECTPWQPWVDELAAAGRVVVLEGSGQKRWFAREAPQSGKEVLRGRLEALGPIGADDPLFTEFAGEILELETEGAVLRARFPGRDSEPGYSGWCSRRLLARIHRYTLDRLRSEIQPVTAAEFLRFLAAWQHASDEAKLDGPRGVLAVVKQLAGFQAPADAWERHILPLRVRGYRRQWLDELAFSGEVAWGRTWGSGDCAARAIPLALLPRADLDTWKALCEPGDVTSLHSDALAVVEVLGETRAVVPARARGRDVAAAGAGSRMRWRSSRPAGWPRATRSPACAPCSAATTRACTAHARTVLAIRRSCRVVGARSARRPEPERPSRPSTASTSSTSRARCSRGRASSSRARWRASASRCPGATSCAASAASRRAARSTAGVSSRVSRASSTPCRKRSAHCEPSATAPRSRASASSPRIRSTSPAC